MSRLTRWLSARSSAPASPPPRFVPRMQVLDDRIVPSFLTTLASTKADGSQVSSNNTLPALSADGRFVAFVSDAKLTADDTNSFSDVYLKDRMTGAVSLVSRADGASGAVGNLNVDTTAAPSISADGRFVAFSSFASNLAGTDNNNRADVFVRDTVAGTTTLVSVTGSGIIGNGDSTQPHISADGKIVSFVSNATNLEAGSPAGINLYHYNLLTRSYARIGSRATANAISADGRYVAFSSTATNLVTGDTNGQADVFVIDTSTFTTTRVSVATGGFQVNGASGASLDISADGRFVAFASVASDLVSGDTNGQSDAFLYDRATGTTTRVSTNANGTESNGTSFNVAISGNGRFIAFSSVSSDLVPGDTNSFSDEFVKDRVTGAITRVSVSTAGAEGNSFSGGGVALSRDGQFVAYDSLATNLAPDANGGRDVFVTQRPLPTAYVAGTGPGGSNVVNVYDAAGTVKTTVTAYPAAYTGGVFVALGDASGDGIDEVVTSTGPGGSANIRVFDGVTGGATPLASFFAYPEGFTGGVNVAIGDVNNDGFADIVCGVGKGGGPNVRIFDGKALLALAAKNDGSLERDLLKSVANGGALLASFYAYDPNFAGGVRVAVADVDGDGFADVICGVGSGGGPNVRVFNAKTLLVPVLATSPNPTFSFFALTPNFLGGVFVSSGDFNNDGTPDMLVGVESGGGPAVTAIDGKKFAQVGANGQTTAQLQSFYAFAPNSTGGVKVASTDLNQDGYDDFVTGTGPGDFLGLNVFSGKQQGLKLLGIDGFTINQQLAAGAKNVGVNVG